MNVKGLFPPKADIPKAGIHNLRTLAVVPTATLTAVDL